MKALVFASWLGIALCLAPASVKAQDAPFEVNAVGTAGVHVGRLSGQEFFDALIRLDQIAAVVVRAR